MQYPTAGPTAVGAVSSANVVHVTSRRWISFFSLGRMSTFMEELPALKKSLYEAVTRNHDGEVVYELVRKGVEIDYVHPYTGHTAL